MADNPDPQRIRDAATAQAELNTLLEAQNNILYDSEATFGELYNAIKASADVIRSGNNEEANRRSILRDSFSELRKTLKNVRDLRDNEKGIVELNDNQLKNKKKLLQSNLDQLKILADQLEQSYGLANASEKQIRKSKKLSENEKELLLAKRAGFKNVQDAIEQTDEQIKAYGRMNSALGLSGALLDNLERVGVRAFGGLGLNLGAFKGGFTDALAAAKDKAKEVGEEMKENNKETATQGQRLRVIAAMGPGLKKALYEGLSDPLVFGSIAINALVKAFNKVQTASVEVSRLTGQNATDMATFQMRIASTADVLEVVSELTRQTGFNANNAFSPETLAAAAEFKNTLGLSADEAGKLAILTQATGTNLDDNFESIVDSVNQFNKANRSAVSQGVVLRDVAKVSDGISASLAGNPGAIAAAAAAARRLGMELSNLDKIADSLMNFEDSIGNELEAQLLTGRDINLAKARELALTNDLKGLGKELFENSADLADFSEMNRIQQQSLAQALGMSRDELARIAYLRAIETGMTEDQAAAAAQVTAEEMKRMTIQENFSKALEKVAQALTPIVELFATLAGNSITFYGMLGAIAAVSLGRLVASLILMKVQLLEAGASAAFTKIALGGLVGITTLIIGAAIIKGIMAGLKADTEVQDAVIPPGKGRVLTGPAGSISFDDRDTIVAGTNLLGDQDSSREVSRSGRGRPGLLANLRPGKTLIEEILPRFDNLISVVTGIHGGLRDRSTIAPIATAVEDVTDRSTIAPATNAVEDVRSNRDLLNKLDRLIAAVEKGGDVYMDSNKVGKALVLGSYSSS